MPGVRWPRACEKTAWDMVNTDLCFALEILTGTGEKKSWINLGTSFTHLEVERFGVEKGRKKYKLLL